MPVVSRFRGGQTRRTSRRAWLAALALVVAGDLISAAQGAPDLETTLARAAERVAEDFARAQSLVCLEIVHLQPLGSGLTADGIGRTVESELRLSWDPAGEDGGTEALTRREVIRVNGRRPRKDDHRRCTTPEQEDTETQPLSMLLPAQRGDYEFKPAGMDRIDNRPAIRLDFRLLTKVTVETSMVEGVDDCISYDVNGGRRGRLWIDAETFDVLRIDERLAGLVEVPLPREAARHPGAQRFWTLERWDSTMRFKRHTFADPEETLVLPVSSTTMTITRGSGTPRLRTVTEYKSYKRFLTGGRVVPDPQN